MSRVSLTGRPPPGFVALDLTEQRDQLAIETAGGGQQFAVELAVTSD